MSGSELEQGSRRQYFFNFKNAVIADDIGGDTGNAVPGKTDDPGK